MKALIVADICWGDGGFGCFLIGLICGFIGSLWAGGSLGVVSCCVGGDGVGAGVVVVVVCSSFSFNCLQITSAAATAMAFASGNALLCIKYLLLQIICICTINII